VTRLREFRQLFTLVSILKIAEVIHIYGLLYSTVKEMR
jgi:hypothetical protein